jgi:hypothetical protein
MGVGVPNNYSGYLPDLKITKDLYLSNVSKLDTHALVSVNGFIHNTASSEGVTNQIYVEEGAKSVDRCRANGIGMLSFADISPIKKIRIKPENIITNSASGRLYDQLSFSVELPNDLTTLDDKSYILVLGNSTEKLNWSYNLPDEELVIMFSGLILIFFIGDISAKDNIPIPLARHLSTLLAPSST